MLIAGSPVLSSYKAIEWNTASAAEVQTYLNSDATKLSVPAAFGLDGIAQELSSYNIKNTTAGAVTVYVRGI